MPNMLHGFLWLWYAISQRCDAHKFLKQRDKLEVHMCEVFKLCSAKLLTITLQIHVNHCDGIMDFLHFFTSFVDIQPIGHYISVL